MCTRKKRYIYCWFNKTFGTVEKDTGSVFRWTRGSGKQSAPAVKIRQRTVRRGAPCCASSLGRWHGPSERISLLQRERALVLCTCMSLLAVFPEIQRKKESEKKKNLKKHSKKKSLHYPGGSSTSESSFVSHWAHWGEKPSCQTFLPQTIPGKVLGFVERVGWGDKLRSP